ncbi:hypothetical protein ACAG39_08010 [Caldicellulosiruptoraceae bacterium PP1]
MEEIKGMLQVIITKIDGVEKRLERVEQRLDNVEKRLDMVEQRLDNLEQDVAILKDRVDKLEDSVNKNAILLEDTKRKVELMAEIQQSYIDQNQREHEQLKVLFNDKIEVVETAVKSLAKDVKEIHSGIDTLAEISGKHEFEISRIRKLLV